MTDESPSPSFPAETSHAPPISPSADSVPPVVEPPPLAPAALPPVSEQPFIFHGEAKEYFRIWIVNTLLTLLSFGVYAARATVRRRRYLWGNTELMGHRFDYLADPKDILSGGSLIAIVFILFTVAWLVQPAARPVVLLAGLALLPWVIIRAGAFNARHTAYRGVRFSAQRTYAQAMRTYTGQWFLIILSLGLYYPAAVRHRHKCVIGGYRLGDARFHFDSKCGPYYMTYLLAALIVAGGGIQALGLGLLSIGLLTTQDGYLPMLADFSLMFATAGLVLYLARQYLHARLFNLQWAGTRLDHHHFKGSLPVGGWLKLQTLNLIAIIATGGLLYPWAVIRATRYRLAHLLFVPDGPAFVPIENHGIGALPSEPTRNHAAGGVRWLEVHAHVVGVTALLLLATAGWTVWRELPHQARQLVMAVPPETEILAGKTALLAVDQVLAPTRLTRADRMRVERQLDRLVLAEGLLFRPVLVHRSMPKLSPNAFALPGGYIVVADELVALASDDELAAVLAHEIGHWRHRHGLRYILRQFPYLLLLFLAKDELPDLNEQAYEIPADLLFHGYPREFEPEADQYAVTLLAKAGIKARHLESITEKLAAARSSPNAYSVYSNTHPTALNRLQLALGSQNALPPAAVGPKDRWSIYSLTPWETAPQIQSTVRPVYPPRLRVMGITGEVKLEFVVDENGDVRLPRVVASSHPGFEPAALKAIVNWEFAPAQSGGRNSASRVTQLIEFKLEDNRTRTF